MLCCLLSSPLTPHAHTHMHTQQTGLLCASRTWIHINFSWHVLALTEFLCNELASPSHCPWGGVQKLALPHCLASEAPLCPGVPPQATCCIRHHFVSTAQFDSFPILERALTALLRGSPHRLKAPDEHTAHFTHPSHSPQAAPVLGMGEEPYKYWQEG